MAEDGTVQSGEREQREERDDRDDRQAAETEDAPPGERPDSDGPGRTRVMLLGSGDLGRELVIALQRLGAEVITVDRRGDAPLHRAADQALVVDLADTDEMITAIRHWRPKFVVPAGEMAGAAADMLAELSTSAGSTEVVPGVRGTRLVADVEGMRRLAADELGLPTVPFWFAGSVGELRAVAEHVGFPMVVTPVAAPAGQGQSVMVRADDIEPAWQRAADAQQSPARVLVETMVEVDDEVTLLTVCNDGPTGPSLEFCPPIGHRNIDGPDGRPVLESWQPHPMSPAALDAARSIAARIVRSLGGRGLFGVELLTRGDEVYFAGVTVRPSDTAWVTLRTQRLSAFELQARAILGLRVDPIMISPGAARLVYSGRQPDREGTPPNALDAMSGELRAALQVAESDVVIVDDPPQPESRPRRRLGVAMATASDVATARARADRVSAALSELWR